MRHCPDELSGVLQIIPHKQHPVGLQDNLPGQIFRIFTALASLERETEYGFQVPFQDALRFLFPHKSLSFPAAALLP